MIGPQGLSGKRILYGCLDWGMGHLSRSIPLIAQLIGQGNEVIAWCSPEQEKILRRFSLPITYVKGFDRDFHFRGDGNFYFEMFRNARRFQSSIRLERKKVAAFAKSNGIDVIISDHRYGMHVQGVFSIFVTHQCRLPARSGFIAHLVHQRWLSRFDGTWIMDEADDRLAGSLSRPLKNSVYIGHHSRFSLEAKSNASAGVVAVISGPEPYAYQFFEKIIDIAGKVGGNWTIVCPVGYTTGRQGIRCLHDWKQGDEALRSAEMILSRCGYSTLMDLKFLGKRALLVPTKGQLEQEYFLRYFRGDYKGEAPWRIVEGMEELLMEVILYKSTKMDV